MERLVQLPSILSARDTTVLLGGSPFLSFATISRSLGALLLVIESMPHSLVTTSIVFLGFSAAHLSFKDASLKIAITEGGGEGGGRVGSGEWVDAQNFINIVIDVGM